MRVWEPSAPSLGLLPLLPVSEPVLAPNDLD